MKLQRLSSNPKLQGQQSENTTPCINFPSEPTVSNCKCPTGWSPDPDTSGDIRCWPPERDKPTQVEAFTALGLLVAGGIIGWKVGDKYDHKIIGSIAGTVVGATAANSFILNKNK